MAITRVGLGHVPSLESASPALCLPPSALQKRVCEVDAAHVTGRCGALGAALHAPALRARAVCRRRRDVRAANAAPPAARRHGRLQAAGAPRHRGGRGRGLLRRGRAAPGAARRLVRRGGRAASDGVRCG
eukprot:5711578-Prymnesium_polylepis.1